MVIKLIDKVRETIISNRLIEKGDHIVLGVSGGPDSACLLSVFRELTDEWGLTLHGVHINHCLRGKDADEDQIYTEELCKKLSVPCHVFRYDVNLLASRLKITTEEAGRKVRYESFEKIKKSIESQNPIPGVKIAIAHNLNDQAETILMRIIRGTGTDGLSGIEYIRQGVFIRPLLNVSRREVEEYCKEHNLQPRIDRSNLEPVYTRNRLRLELLPLLQAEYNENILSALDRLSRIACEDKEYLYLQVDKVRDIVSGEGDSRIISRKDYLKLHPAIGKRLIGMTLKEMGLVQDMTAVHLEGADNLMRKGKTGGRIDFPGGYGLRLVYEGGELYRLCSGAGNISDPMDARPFCYPIRINKTIRIPELNALLKVRILQADQNPILFADSPFSACLDLGRMGIINNMTVRTRMPGDYIVPFGMKGTKKLQDFFVDEKIKKEERGRIPLVCLGQEVLWVVGRRINENYKVTEKTKEAIYIEFEPSA